MKNKFFKSRPFFALLSVVVAFALWAYVITVVNPEYEETYKNVPVVLQNESILDERGLMVVSQTQSVTLRLKGNRSELANINSSNISVVANVSGVVAAGTHQLSFTPSFSGDMFGSDVSVQYRNPNAITLVVEKKVTKQVPVELVYEGSVPEGFLADKDNAQLSHTAVEVTGPQSSVDLISKAVVKVNLNLREETLVEDMSYVLCNYKNEPVDASSVTTNVEKVQLTLKIQRIKEVKLVLEILEGGGATAEDCTVIIDPETIQITGSEALLEGITELKIGTINLGEITKNQSLSFPIVLPEGVNNVTGITEAKVDIDFGSLGTKTVQVTDLKAINLPEGMDVEFLTQALEITLRGPKELVDKMEASDLTVTVDFTGAEQGTVTIKAKITTSDEYAQVGAVGTYSVSATLRKADLTRQGGNKVD